MTIESSGAISLGTTAGTDRSISGELGGTQPHALSEYYRDGSYSDGVSIPATETGIPTGNWNGFTYTEEIKFSDFYGVSGPEAGSLPSTWFLSTSLPVPQPRIGFWGHKSITSTSSPAAGASVGFFNDQANDRIAMRDSTYDSSASQTYNYSYISYTGYATETFQAKCQYSLSAGSLNSSGCADNPDSSSPASNTYANISTSTYSPVWQWNVSATSSNTSCSLSASSGTSASDDRPYWTIANSVATDTLSGLKLLFQELLLTAIASL